jgi:hypothetical protein
VAVVIEPTNATLYLGSSTNTLSSTNNPITHEVEAWAGTGQIGHQVTRLADQRLFKGSIDEVAVFNYAFTPVQVLNLYHAAFSGAAPVTLSVQKIGANVQLSWPQGTLLEANDLTGPWTTNNATSPYTFAPIAAKKFFRVKVQ